jgi:hypothetical protein
MPNNTNTTLEPGTLVLCSYRLPPVLQPWVHEFHIGVVEVPADDANHWGGKGSEAAYCEATGTARVRYGTCIQHERVDALIPITPEQAVMPHRNKVATFLGEEALAYYDRAMHGARLPL